MNLKDQFIAEQKSQHKKQGIKDSYVKGGFEFDLCSRIKTQSWSGLICPSANMVSIELRHFNRQFNYYFL